MIYFPNGSKLSKVKSSALNIEPLNEFWNCKKKKRRKKRKLNESFNLKISKSV